MGSVIQIRPFSATTRDQSERSAYIGWSPVRLTLIGTPAPGETNRIRLKCRSITSDNTQVEFKASSTAAPVDELEVELDGEGAATCFIAGKFQEGNRHNGASPDGKDVRVEAAWVDDSGDVKGALDFMVRVRRDAQQLSATARDDFTWALAELNGCGKGVYVTDFVALHVAGADESQHGDTHFLPWHRLYLLDLERQLQEVNPAVTLPYWRFDKPAPNVFDSDFMGKTQHVPIGAMNPITGLPENFTPGTSGGNTVEFSNSNRLSDWKIGSTNGIERISFFDTKKEAATGWPNFPMRTEDQTLALGGDRNEFGFRRRPARGFARMEGTPHGAAHVSFNGTINTTSTAPQDPLFFLLHCNVDRLWAKWQFAFMRDLPTEFETYSHQNKREISFTNTSYLLGLFPEEYTVVNALQWPWDDTWAKPYNLRAPGTRSRNFTKTRTGKEITENMPSILDALDAFGHRSPDPSFPNSFNNYLGFAYDDVPFDHERPNT